MFHLVYSVNIFILFFYVLFNTLLFLLAPVAFLYVKGDRCQQKSASISFSSFKPAVFYSELWCTKIGIIKCLDTFYCFTNICVAVLLQTKCLENFFLIDVVRCVYSGAEHVQNIDITIEICKPQPYLKDIVCWNWSWIRPHQEPTWASETTLFHHTSLIENQQ